ncbi:alpha/beta hydrolase fold domain-containing protein [Kitasatospora sp. NPDC127111]|uniref:alpha/beta hydrolase fold domain-containing protein n=1 Tax=Kitasatospora sp. NPDC127111 TaxID=3345363 RepID=UPI003635C64F
MGGRGRARRGAGRAAAGSSGNRWSRAGRTRWRPRRSTPGGTSRSAGQGPAESVRLGGDAPPVPHGQDRVLASGVRVRVFVPDHVDGVYLHVQGGGRAFGSADGQDEKLWTLATDARLAVVSVDYRFAPEHPWPEGGPATAGRTDQAPVATAVSQAFQSLS